MGFDTLHTPVATDIKAHKQVLSNGLSVITVEMPHLHTVELALLVRAGLRFETAANNGIFHFLEHMLFRGNRHFPDSVSLSQQFERIGRDLRASTLTEYTYFGFSPHPPHLERGVELLSLFIDQPTFPDLEVEREIILEECLEDLNAEGKMVDINNLACQLLYKGDPLAWPTIGTEETIRSIDAPMLAALFARFYHPANMILVGSGRVSHETFLELAERYFGRIPKRGPGIPKNYFHIEESQREPAVFFQEDRDSQVQAQVCFRALSFNHPDHFVLCLMSQIFDDGVGSRLQRALREDSGLVYSVECRTTCWSDTGTFDFDVQVRPEKAPQTLDILFAEIKSFREQGPTQEELDHVKNRYRFDLNLDLDDPYKQIARYGESELYSEPLTLEEEWARVEAVTRDAMAHLARQILTPEKLNVILVGPLSGDLRREVMRLTDAF